MLEMPVPIPTLKFSSIGPGEFLNRRLLGTPGAAGIGLDNNNALGASVQFHSGPPFGCHKD